MTALVIIMAAGYVVLILGGLILWRGHRNAARIRQLKDEDAAMDLANGETSAQARVTYAGEADCS